MNRFFGLGAKVGLLLLAAGSTSLWGLDPGKSISQFTLDHWQAMEGLNQSTVQAIAQTVDGYLWLGTRGGLIRFDGVRFVLFDGKNTPAIAHDNIAALVADPDGGLWIGSSEGGLIHYKHGSFKRVPTGTQLRSTSIRSLLLGPDGSLWIGTFGNGVTHWKDGRAQLFTIADGLPNGTVRALAFAREGGVWVGTDAGLCRIADGKVKALDPRSPLSGVFVNTVYADPNGDLWVGTNDNGLLLVKQGRTQRFTQKDGLCGLTVRGIQKDRDGNLWVATTGGLNRWRAARFDRFTQGDGLSQNYVRCLYEDREGGLWLGLLGGGLNRLKDPRFSNYSTAEGLSDDFTFTVLETRDNSVWIGTQQGGLNRLKNGKIEIYNTANGLPSNSVVSLAESGDGTLWIGTTGNVLTSYKNGSFRHFSPKDGLTGRDPKQIAEGPDGSIWMATTIGLCRYFEGRWTTYPLPAADPSLGSVASIVVKSDGTLFVGGVLGLFHFEAGVYRQIEFSGGTSRPKIHDLYEDPDGVLWVATNGAGLYRLAFGRVTTFTTRDGLPDGVIYNILEDNQQNLWMTSNHGVFRASRKALNDVAEGRAASAAFGHYDVADGMRSSECNGGGGGHPAGWKSHDGRLWFPTVRGVSVVDPTTLTANKAPVPVLIESVIGGGSDIYSRGEATLAAGGGDIQIDYTGLSLLAPSHIHFSYKLEGFDRDWTAAGTRRTAFYTRIPPGSYRFRVKACNRDGVWNETETTCNIRVPRLFYQTRWFLGFVVSCCALLVLGILRVRENRIRAREAADALRKANAELELRVNQRTAELAEANHVLRTEMAERHRAEEILRLTQASVDNASLPTFWIAPEGRILRVNQAACDMLSYSSEELLQMRIGDVDPDATPESHAAVYQKLRRDGKTEFEARFRRKDGRILPVAVSVCTIDFEGREYLLSFVRDMSEPKRLETQIRQMQKMEAIGRLAGGIAHDFNNLLTVINGYSRMSLAGLAPGDRLRHRLEQILEAGERAASLTAQLMTFSRKGVTQKKLLNLNQVIRDGSDLLRRLIPEDIELRYVLDCSPGKVRADATQMQQLLMNLAVNARDAMPSGGRLVIETSHADLRGFTGTGTGDEVPAGRYAVISVTDNGLGMDDNVKRHLFEPFFTTKSQGQGTGLGLSTVYGFVRNSDGYVTVRSELSQGTTFRVYLPLAESETESAVEPSSNHVAELSGAETILLVEDEGHVRELVRTVLESAGYRVLEASDGAKALALLAREGCPPDLLITDAVMPGLSGRELSARIRGQWPELKVLFVSGYTMDRVSEQDLAVPGTGFLAKPFSPADIAAKVREILDAPVHLAG